MLPGYSFDNEEIKKGKKGKRKKKEKFLNICHKAIHISRYSHSFISIFFFFFGTFFRLIFEFVKVESFSTVSPQ